MASESDSEEFFDAEDKALNVSKGKTSNLRLDTTNEKVSDPKLWEEIKSPCPTAEEMKEADRKAKDNERRRKKVEELRRKMLTDEDDETEALSQPSSKTSSIDGVYMGRYDSKLPSRFGKEPAEETKSEVNSVISLGKVGSLLGNVNADTVSIDSRDSMLSTGECGNQFPLVEPDVVASTKGDRNLNNDQPPVAPPRRRRKINKQHSLDVNRPLQNPAPIQGLPSPISAVESIAHELEYSLDLKSATRGQYVVKPQDHERDRAPIAVKDTPLTLDSLEGKSEPRLPTPKGSLGAHSNKSNHSRRNSGGATTDEAQCQMNFMMRTRSDSGRPLTDLEILEQVMVLNLDTGEAIPLSLAEDRLPRGINPLSLHIMRLTSEYVSNSSLEKDKESDEESVAESHKSSMSDTASVLKKTAKFKKMIGRTVEKTVNKIKNVADEVYHSKHNDDIEDSEEDNIPTEARPSFKFKAAHGHKGPYEFDTVKEVQDLTGEHTGAIWTMKFSFCGRLLATAGQDHILRIWVLRDSYNYFNEMRLRYNAEIKVSPTPSQESLVSQQSVEDPTKLHLDTETSEDHKGPFMSKPFCTYQGHTADLLDVSWSKNYFILSSSMDKTVRLWHISRKECLCCFQHIDFVTAIAFHPRDDRYFLSGSLDGKLRLWNIPDKKVALWNELDGQTKLITSASFCQNGKFAVIGSYDGRCIFYHTEQLKYYTQIHVRSSRGKNKQGRKISGIEPMPGEDKILVTSNDSRIRMYDLRDLSLSCKYKGYVNLSSQIKSNFSHDGKYIISGSENQFIYIWKTNYDYSKFSSARRDRNYYWEGIKAHNAVVTSAVFAPNPSLILSQLDQQDPTLSVLNQPSHSEANPSGYVFVSADFSGVIKVFVKKNKGKATTLPVGLP